ncbi:MAG: UDP-N-acetylglucosamine 2-epimerase [Candidatus ainarchaeum sp.]|nr:UDP-N-acetylglucosamine 2-epimerase [Candidatus ainarchaeum sp.]MDD5163422.1 UDP-N-acetylglucosamine 2-epimerase [Candidatus ainarchaeum sp.]
MAKLVLISGNENLDSLGESIGRNAKILLLNPEFQEILSEKKLEFVTPDKMVGEKIRGRLLEKAVSITQELEKSGIEYKGINLMRAKSCELTRQLYISFFEALALANAVKKFSPEETIACRNTKGEEYLAVLGIKNKKIICCGEKKMGGLFLDHAKKRAGQISGKLLAIIAPSPKKKANSITVFSKSRGYFDELQNRLAQSKGFDLFSTEEALLRHSLNPKNWLEKNTMPDAIRNKAEKALLEKSIIKKCVIEKTDFSGLVRSAVKNSVESDFPKYAGFINAMEKEFVKRKPKIVLLWVDSVPFERITALLAKKFCSVSVVLQHGIPAADRLLLKGWLPGFAPLTADFFFSWGKNTSRLMRFHNVPEKRIFETGNPRFEEIVTKKFERQKTMEKLGIKKSGKIILVLTQPMFYGFNPMEMARAAINAAEKNPGVNCVIKTHPVEHFSGYEKRFAKRAIISRKISLHELIDAADAVIGNSSTSLIEAMLFEKPVIIFDPGKTAGFYEKNSAVLYAGNARELEGAVRSVFEKPETLKLLGKARKEFLKKELEFVENSGEKTIGLLKKIAGEN